MASKPKKRKTRRTTPPLTRAMLLPMSAELASKVSLQNHLALVALRQGQGNADLIAELLKTVYVAYDLLDPSQLATQAGYFTRAETAIKTLIKQAAATGEWRLAEEQCEGIEVIVSLHDAQLAVLPTHRIEVAKQRLMRVLEKESFPELVGR